MKITVDRDAVARVGLTPAEVVDAVRIGLAGKEVSQVWVGQRRFDLVVRLADDRRNDLSGLTSLLIDGRDGTRVPLGQLARVERTFDPPPSSAKPAAGASPWRQASPAGTWEGRSPERPGTSPP